jgi:hypothetical protein
MSEDIENAEGEWFIPLRFEQNKFYSLSTTGIEQELE